MKTTSAQWTVSELAYGALSGWIAARDKGEVTGYLVSQGTKVYESEQLDDATFYRSHAEAAAAIVRHTGGVR